MPKWKKKQRIHRASQQRHKRAEGIVNTKYSHVFYVCKLLIATPPPSIQPDPIASEVSGSTNSTPEQVPAVVSELIDLVAAIGLPVDVNKCMTKASLQLQCDPRGTAEPPQVHNSRCSWPMNYTVPSFMMNGHLYAEYNRLTGMLGLPHCLNQQWLRIIGRR